MGNITSDWEDPGRFSPQGGPSAGKDAAEEDRGGHVDLSVTGRGNEGSGAGRGGDVRPPLPEYRRPVYRHLADTGAMSGGGATAGGRGPGGAGAGVDEMVGAGRTQPRAGRDGGEGGGVV